MKRNSRASVVNIMCLGIGAFRDLVPTFRAQAQAANAPRCLRAGATRRSTLSTASHARDTRTQQGIARDNYAVSTRVCGTRQGLRAWGGISILAGVPSPRRERKREPGSSSSHYGAVVEGNVAGRPDLMRTGIKAGISQKHCWQPRRNSLIGQKRPFGASAGLPLAPTCACLQSLS